MISDLHVLDDKTVCATGPKFDAGKVRAAAEAFLRSLIGELALIWQGERVGWISLLHAEPAYLVDDRSYARLWEWLYLETRGYDVVEADTYVVAGPFSIRLVLRGRSQLYLNARGAGKPTLIDDRSWLELDPTPAMQITPADQVRGVLSHLASGASFWDAPCSNPSTLGRELQTLLRRHAPPGTVFVEGYPTELLFPHESFGAGHGRLRIALTVSRR